MDAREKRGRRSIHGRGRKGRRGKKRVIRNRGREIGRDVVSREFIITKGSSIWEGGRGG